MKDVYISVADIPTYMQEKYFKNKDMISIDDILWAFEDLDSDYENLKEEYEDFKKDVEDNYRVLSPSEMYGIDDQDFLDERIVGR